jgi:hypothetical protein
MVVPGFSGSISPASHGMEIVFGQGVLGPIETVGPFSGDHPPLPKNLRAPAEGSPG